MGYSKAEIYGNAKLSHAQVRAVRARGAGGEHPRDLAREFGVAPSTIRKILAWETYTMVPEVGPEAPAKPALTGADVAASFARLQKLVPEHVPASLEEALRRQAEAEEGQMLGLARLNAEAAKLGRGDAVLEELTGRDNPSVVGSTIPANNGQPTDGGKNG